MENEIQMENLRHSHHLEVVQRNAKLEAVRLAQQVLIENARSKPVDSREVSAQDITNYAATLVNYINE